MFTKIKWELRSSDEFCESCFSYAVSGDASNPHLLPAGKVSNSHPLPSLPGLPGACETPEKERKCVVPIAQKPERAWMKIHKTWASTGRKTTAAQVMGTYRVDAHGPCPISLPWSFSSHLREDPEVREEAGLVEVTEKFRRPDEEHANSHTLFKKCVGYLLGIWLGAKKGTRMETQTQFVPGGICALALEVAGLVSTGN